MPTSPIDLCTVSDVSTWGNFPSAIAPTSDPKIIAVIQEVITGWSRFVLWRTGRKDSYFTGVPAANPSNPNDFTVFTEIRDGNDGSSMGVLNGPIQNDPTKTSVQINGQNVPQSLAWNQLGWFIEQNPSFIGLRKGTGFLQNVAGFPGHWYGGRFAYGKGNVSIAYPGGYNAVPEDLFLATLRAVTIYTNARLRDDESGRTTPQTGAVTTYRTFPWSKDISQVLANYTRTMLSFG